ncbi:TPA: virB8 family protein [Serratia fonticola]
MESKEKEIKLAQSFEQIIEVNNQRSKKIAWSVAIVSMFLAIVCAVALVIAMPLKQTELKVVTVDNTTGRTEVITTVKEEKITHSEVLARHFSDVYLKLREGYNYPSLQHDYEMVQRYSSPTVKSAYLDLFNSENAPDKVYKKNDEHVAIDIISKIITPATSPDQLATVRFKKTIRNLRRNEVRIEYWSARITFHFNPAVKMKNDERDENPLGFVVTSFYSEKELRG